MSFLIYLHKGEFQPEDPQILDSHLKPDTQLTFVDFIPSITKRSATSIISGTEIEYHPFKEMVKTANEWLSENADYDVINCETTKIMFKFNDSQNYYDLRYNDVSNYIFGTEKNNLLKALRVWIRRREMVAGADASAANETANANSNLDAGYVTDSLSPDTPQLESPKLSNLSSILKRRWTQPQQQLQKTPNKQAANSGNAAKAENPQKASQTNVEIHSTDHSPVKKNAFQQQQAFRLQQYSSQSKFFLNKLQRQASCPPSRDTFQISHTAQQSSSAQNSPVYNAKPSHNQHSASNQQQINQQAVGQAPASQPSAGAQISRGKRPVVLNYVDILPECNEESGKFERLEDCLRKLNRLIKGGEIAGRILNVETGSCEATVKWKIDTEISFTALTSKNVNFLRCFYVENEQPEANERIKVQDFVPDHLSAAGFFKRPRFESFSLLIPKLTEWLVNNPECKFKGAQTLDIKLKSYVSQSQTELIDTKSMHFTEHGDYLRILRLVYSERAPDRDSDNEASMNEQLVSLNQSITNLLGPRDIEEGDLSKKKNGTLVKQDSDTSGQSGSNDLMSRSTNIESNLGENLREARKEAKQSSEDAKKDSVADCDSLVRKLRDFSAEDKRQIYLSSKLFLCHRKGQTINDLKQEIQEWSKNYQLEMRSKSANAVDAAKPRILACETIQLFCKQNFFEMNKNNDFTYLQKASEETFMYNRFGLKNGYLVNAFRVWFDVGWFAWNRLGYAQKLSYAQKLRRKRFNYSTSVDEEHLKEPTAPATRAVRAKPLSRRESVGDFYQGKEKLGELDPGARKGSQEAGRRRSCIEGSLEEDYELKLLTDDQIVVKSIRESDGRPGNKLGKLENKSAVNRSTNEGSAYEKAALIDKSNYESNSKSGKSVRPCKDDKDSLMLESELSEFSSLSMLANVSKLESSNSSLSTSIASNEESRCPNQPDEKLSTNLKRKIRRINFRQQSIDNQDNCSLV